MITIDGKKMGKSLGNFINLEQFFNGEHEKLEKEFSPMTIRFFILQAHYRSTLDFGNYALKAAEKQSRVIVVSSLFISRYTLLKMTQLKKLILGL